MTQQRADPSEHTSSTAGPGAAGWPRLRPSAAPALRSGVRRLGLRLIGRCYRTPPMAGAPRSLLLIRPDHLGDLLFLTPALHQLRAALPTARITLLVGPWSLAVVDGNADADAVLTCAFPGFERRPKTNPLAPYRLLFETARWLRESQFDAALVLRSDHWWGAWLAAAAGIPRRIGYDRPETRPFLTDALPYRPERHEVQQNAALLDALAPGAHGADRLGSTRFAVSAADRAWAAAWLGTTAAPIAIHPGAGAAVKQWPPAAWAAVAGRLAEVTGAPIVLTGSAGERPLTAAVAAAMPCPARDAAGETTLGQLAALYERCALVLGSDSGPLHLAVAAGAPTVHLYGPVAPARFGPWGDPARHAVLTTDWPCAPCERLDWPPAVLAQHACMGSITPDQVVHAASNLLRGA